MRILAVLLILCWLFGQFFISSVYTRKGNTKKLNSCQSPLFLVMNLPRLQVKQNDISYNLCFSTSLWVKNKSVWFSLWLIIFICCLLFLNFFVMCVQCSDIFFISKGDLITAQLVHWLTFSARINVKFSAFVESL